jgi:phenylpropionate dioxygenase-like ring-hydroxylating dioxygenase large terminal subunit
MTMPQNNEINYGGLVESERLSGRVYYDYDRAIFQDEIDKIWHREWIYVAHESEVTEPGDYVTRTIGLQPVIVSRDEDNTIHLLLNRCMHRGNTVCQSERGNAHAFRCAYHG